jgi:hypothetical protein
MASARRQERRAELVAQAALVWSLGEVSAEDVIEFVRCGRLPSGRPQRPRLSPELRAEVDRKIDEIVASGGKLIVTGVATWPEQT